MSNWYIYQANQFCSHCAIQRLNAVLWMISISSNSPNRVHSILPIQGRNLSQMALRVEHKHQAVGLNLSKSGLQQLQIIKLLTLRLLQMHSNDGPTMQRTEHTVQTVITHLQRNVWNQLALKVIDKMPRKILTHQTNRLLTDFAFLNTQMAVTTGQIAQDAERRVGVRERQLAGFAEFAKKQLSQPAQTNSSNMHRLSTRRKRKQSTRMPPDQTPPIPAHSQIKNTTFCRLFVSQPTQEQLRKEEQLRNNKCEVAKYARQLQTAEKQQRLLTEQRSMALQRKIKEAKDFTFDYQGRIVNVPKKQGANLKIFNIKPFFKTAPKVTRRTKAVFSHTLGSCEKVTTIKNKRVVSLESRFFEQDDLNEESSSFQGKLSMEHTLADMFKNGKDVELGVSITDTANHSKIYAENNQKASNRLKLSQFKEMRSSFKPRNRQISDLLKDRSSNAATQMLEAKRQRESLMDSDAQSKLLSSSFSFFMQRSGKIEKNDRLFCDNFG